jgi:hypothetical protein
MWQDKPFSYGHAWIDLLISANIKDTKFVKRSQVVEVKRGQIAISTKGFADRWGWSRGKVARFLNQLENEHQIEHQKTSLTTLITIVNYDDYNGTDTKTDIKRTSNGHQTDTSKEVKEVKNKELSDFETVWKLYPNKDGKKQAEKHFHAGVKTEKDFADIMTALGNYKTHLTVETWKKPKNGSTWFNNWHDWIDWKEQAEKDYTDNPIFHGG